MDNSDIIVGVGTENINVLTVNAGSSSIKLRLFKTTEVSKSYETIFKASVTGIGQATGYLYTQFGTDIEHSKEVEAQDQSQAISLLIELLNNQCSADKFSVIGHRIVHGGPKYHQPEIITDDVVGVLESYSSLDPQHMPFALKLINDLRANFPDVLQVACFDTAFFHEMPRVSRILPLPRKYEAGGLRRYGFHGLSYTYLQDEFCKIAGETAVNGRVIYAHLGSGASLSSTYAGKPVDTTMGFSPTSGILMSSRSGDIDPSIALYLEKQYGVGSKEFNHIANFESGLVGVSGLSSDMLTLLQNEAVNENASDAVNLFVNQVKKSIGSLSATIGGLDSLVFSGGIGEKSPEIRSRICSDLGYLGVDLDPAQNNIQGKLISSPASQVGVHVIPTDESKVIASQSLNTFITNQNGGNY